MSDAQCIVYAAVEGIVDEAILRRLIHDAGALPGAVYNNDGKNNLRKKIKAYNEAAKHSPWIVLLDLNHEEGCAPSLRNKWLTKVNQFMCFRVAVREIESWLLADKQRIAQFLGVAIAKVPSLPDSLDDPKRIMVDLARHSRYKAIREDMVPRPNSGRSEGPAYASRLMEFIRKFWRPSAAEKNSDSLRRCRRAIRLVLDSYQGTSP
jgi:hypothetical protein